MITKRIPAIIVGLVFLASGLGKIGNIIGFQHLIYDYGLNSFQLLAPIIVLAEILIGILLIFNIQVKTISIVSICMLIIFTCAYLYGWLKNGITDCGCFGNYIPIPTSPTLTFTRNSLLIALLICTFCCAENIQSIADWKIITVRTVMICASFVAGMSYKPLAFVKRMHPYENQILSSTPLKSYAKAIQGDSELIFFFSYSCPHCINSMENFKAWKETNTIDKLTAYVVVDSTNTQIDSLKNLFQYRFPTIHATELNIQNIKFIDAYPSAYVIRHDTIQNVIIGELPSPYLFE